MKISEVIAELEKLKEEYGDVPVVVYSHDGGYCDATEVTRSYDDKISVEIA